MKANDAYRQKRRGKLFIEGSISQNDFSKIHQGEIQVHGDICIGSAVRHIDGCVSFDSQETRRCDDSKTPIDSIVDMSGTIDRNGTHIPIQASFVESGFVCFPYTREAKTQLKQNIKTVSFRPLNVSDLSGGFCDRLMKEYQEDLVSIMMTISGLCEGVGWHVLEEVKRLLFLQGCRKHVDFSQKNERRKVIEESMARLALLKKQIHTPEIAVGSKFHDGEYWSIRDQVEKRLEDATHFVTTGKLQPVLYLKIRHFEHSEVYSYMSPSQLQQLILRQFQKLWMAIADTSLRCGNIISTATLVLDFSDLSWNDFISYSFHRFLDDLREVIFCFTPVIVTKIILYKVKQARHLQWEIFRLCLGSAARIIAVEDNKELLQHVRPEIKYYTNGFPGGQSLPVTRIICKEKRIDFETDEKMKKKQETLKFWEKMNKLWSIINEKFLDTTFRSELEDTNEDSYDQNEKHQKRKNQNQNDIMERYEELIQIKDNVDDKVFLGPSFSKALYELHTGMIDQSTAAPYAKECISLQIAKKVKKEERHLLEARNYQRLYPQSSNVYRDNVKVCMWKNNDLVFAKFDGIMNKMLSSSHCCILGRDYFDGKVKPTFSFSLVQNGNPLIPITNKSIEIRELAKTRTQFRGKVT